jgi:hypothetical protein
VKEFWANVTKEQESKVQEWEGVYSKFASSHPEEFEEIERRFRGACRPEEATWHG